MEDQMSCLSSILQLRRRPGVTRAGVLGAAAMIGLVGMAAPSYADVVRVGATLSGTQEVPPVTTKGTGVLTATYDTMTHKLDWTVSYSGLTGTPFAAHFHGPAPAGKNAPIEVVAPNAEKNPIKGNAVLTAKEASDLLSGNMYFNIHTHAHPTGEIRGLIKQMKPS
jgi:hypothetical protein